MEKQWNRFIINAGIVLSAATVSAVATPARAADGGVVEIPTQLSNEPTNEEQDGTCAACTINYIAVNDDEEEEGTAIFQLYFEDNGEDEVSDVWVKVLLCEGEYQFVRIQSVELTHGQIHELEASSGTSWSWSDVCYAWVGVD